MIRPCVLCLNATDKRCLECGDAYCDTHETVLCPMCHRVKQFKREQAASRRVVYWQYVEVSYVEAPLHLRAPGWLKLGSITEPMETVQVKAW